MAEQSPTRRADAGETEQRRRLGGGAIATLVGIALLVIVIVQNSQHIRVKFLFWDWHWPTWLFGLAMAVVGALIWFGAGVLRRHRRRKERRAER
jgi:uncharacterized integral membrane protein